MTTSQDVAEAYDAIAADYDLQLAGDAWMRSVLWAHYARLFRPGHRVLDVSCGTGSDALFLAGRGIRVTGIDLSPGMIARLRARTAGQGLADPVDARVMDLAGLDTWPSDDFDGILSAFAGLNTTPDLAPFASSAARLLRPGGHLVVHLLNRFSLWEWLGFLQHGRWKAARRLGSQSQRIFVIGGRPIQHYLFFPGEAYQRFFAHHFLLNGAYSLGSLRPPHTLLRIPSPLVQGLGRLDRWAGPHRPFLNWGRFFVLDMSLR